MLITQMTISSHCQSAAIFVPQPAAYRGDVHARFNASCCKEVPQVVMGDPAQHELSTCGINGFLTLANLHDRRVRPLFIFPLGPNALKEPPHIRDHRDTADLPVLGASHRITADNNLSFCEVTIPSVDARSLAFAAPTVCKELR